MTQTTESTPTPPSANKFKHRIVGAVVLVALVVIFVPMLFNPQESEQPPSQVIVDTPAMPSIPPEPEFKIKEVEVPEPVVEPELDIVEVEPEPQLQEPISSEPAPTAVPEPKKQVAKPTPAPAAKPGIDKSNRPKSWSVQVSSTSSQTGANALRDEFRKKGYKAYVRPEGETFKVLVGPFIRQSDAISECDKIKQRKRDQAACFIVRYQP